MHHIFIVDDDVNFRRSLAIHLEFEGFEVTGCESAQHAFSLLKQSRVNFKSPDVIITDIRMPDMTGDEFVLKLQQDYPSIPVIVISAFDPPDNIVQYPFLRKPFKITDMIETIYKVGEGELN